MLNGEELPVRPNLGIYTQPISFIGLPVVAVPVPLKSLPIAVQIIAPPWREDIALRVARALEQIGVVAADRPIALEGRRTMNINPPLGTPGTVINCVIKGLRTRIPCSTEQEIILAEQGLLA